jgi:small GTP-binding protein
LTPVALMKRIKIVTVGNAGTGKTSIIRYFCFREVAIVDEPTTVGVDSIQVRTSSADNVQWEVHLFDTAGTEQYRSLIPSYLRGAAAVLLVFDHGCRGSFKAIDAWLAYLEDRCDSLPRIYLVGNKVDLPVQEVSDADLAIKAHNSPLIQAAFETSAVTGQGIDTMMATVLADCSETAAGGTSAVITETAEIPEVDGCC